MKWRSLLVVAAVVSCGRDSSRNPEVVTPGAPTPLQVTTERFRSLAWIEGRWRGTENDSNPFYEAYRFVNDSTIRSYFYDSTGTRVTDSGTVALRGGTVTTGDSATSWTVTALDSASVRFEPVRGAVNDFIWERLKDGTWSATLTVHMSDGNMRARVYHMRPVQ